MATSGTTNFVPSLAELTVTAYGRCQIRRPMITAAHLVDARMEINILLQEWGVRGVNLWEVDLVEIPLIANQATYQLERKTNAMLDAYITTGTGVDENDRVIMPVSRSDYASYPNKTQPGTPTVFWFDRLIAPQVTLWQTPDDTQGYILKFYRMKQIEDANLADGEQPDIPNRFLSAFIAGLAWRCAINYASADIEARRKADYDEAWALASTDDVEDVGITIQPQMGGYYRS